MLGGGQLGRMFVHAAQRMGFRCVVLDPDPDSPAGSVAQTHLCADYLDDDALARLASAADAITTEFENVPALALRKLADRRVVAPGAAAVAICQDRAQEKAHFERCGVACAPWCALDADTPTDSVAAALLPGIVKTARLGYDGKGQRVVRDHAELAAARRAFGGVPCVLERRLELAHEISVVLARGADGACMPFAPLANVHRDGILALTRWPAPLPPALQQQALDAAAAIAASLHYVGVLCVEFFVLADGRLLANEMAPRPHNSGHCTIDAADVSQFDWQVRALAGLPLAAPRRHSCALMLNLLGELWFDQSGAARTPDWRALLELPGVHLHLYGKREARRGRKMGHLTLTAPTPEQADALAREAARRIGWIWP